MTVGKLGQVGRRLRDGRRRPRARGEDGFILLESIVAISLITVIMGALATFTINAVSITGEQRARQAAAQIATTTMATLRSIPATEIVSGRTSTPVKAQIAEGKKNKALLPYLNSMNLAPFIDIAPTAGSTPAVPTSVTQQELNNVTYSISTYMGTCVVATGSPDCVPSGSGLTFVLVVVAVTWPDSNCPTEITDSTVATCTYVTTTLVNKEPDPVFNIGQTAATAPVPVNPGNQTSTAGANVALQLDVRSGTGVPTYTWSVTAGALPAGLTLSASGLISNSSPATVATAATSVTVQVIDAFGRSGSMTFTWTVVAKPTVTKPANQSSAVGQAVNLAVASTCPNTPCTFTLAGAPAGLSISASTGAITGAATTAGTSANVTVTITDSDNVAATTAAFTWTVVSGPTIGTPGTLTATIGNAKSVPLTYTCPGPPCDLTLAGTGTNILGLGLASTATPGANNATTLRVTAASGTVYIAGIVQGTAVTSPATSRVYTPTVKIANVGSGANVTSPAGSWTIFAKPTVGALGTRTVNVGADTNVPITYSCPNAPCTLTLVNTAAARVPGLGLSNVNGGSGTNNTVSFVVSDTSGTVYINGTVSGTAVTTGQTKDYAMSLSIADSTSVASAASTATWTASKAPKVVNPGTQALEPGQTFTLQMAASCPNGGCTWTSAQVQFVGDTTWYPITISSSGLINYANAPGGQYTARVTVRDSTGATDTATFALKVQDFFLTIPNQTTSRPGVFTLDVAPLVTPVADGYTYAITGTRPSWLSIDADTGVLTATLTGATPLDTYNVTVKVTSTTSATSTVSDSFNWTIT